MSEPIITKRCSCCKDFKPLSEFHKRAKSIDGHQNSCKICQKYYSQTPKGKEVRRRAHRKYNQSKCGKAKNRAYSQGEKRKIYIKNYEQHEKRRTYMMQYRQSEKYKIYQRKYKQTNQYKAYCKNYNRNYRQTEQGKKFRRLGIARWRLRHPEQWKANVAIREAIRIGQLPRPDSLQCHYCPAQAEQYHHYLGYEPEHWLDVVPACIKCHNLKHRKAS